MNRKGSGRSWSSQGRDGLPDSLRNAKSPYVAFDNARDPSRKRLRDAMKKTESQRRGEQGQGSQMVKLHKPFPELKPKNQQARHVLRQSFNQRWIAEKRQASHSPQKGDAFDKIDQAKAERSKTYERSPSPGPSLGR